MRPLRTTILALVALSACARPQSEPRQDGVCPRPLPWVPPVPPDSIPSFYYEHQDAESGIPLDMIAVEFVSGTPVDVKSRIICSVGGEVVGGLPDPNLPGGGMYLIRIPLSDLAGAVAVQSKLLEHPEVSSAGLDIPIGPGEQQR